MDKERAREYLIKSKIYRFMALVFAGMGVILFVYSFSQNSEGGDILAILRDPVRVVFVLFPFAPAVVLSFKARKAERQLHEIIKDDKKG